MGTASDIINKTPPAQTALAANGSTPAPSVMGNTRISDTNSSSRNSNSSLVTKAVTPIQTEPLKKMLTGYQDKRYVILGLEEGFDIAYKGEQIGFDANNALSANSQPNKVLTKITTELQKNRIAGPFVSPPLPNFKTSPLAIRDKTEPGKYRLLHNLSYPHDQRAVNLNINQCDKTVSYASIRDAMHIIANMETPFLAKADIADAFRPLPVHPNSHNLLGFKFQGLFYYDKCLPMGCAASCKIFERFSDELVYILKTKYKVQHIVKVLDDFLLLGNSKEECQHALNAFTHLADTIGLPLAQHKTVQPTSCLTFLGIELDAGNRIARLPSDKVMKYQSVIQDAIDADHITLNQLQSLIGKLQFSTSTTRGGRCFIRRLYDATIGKTSPFTKISLKDDAIDDLHMWQTFLSTRNDIEILAQPVAFAHTLCTDASLTGYGGT